MFSTSGFPIDHAVGGAAATLAAGSWPTAVRCRTSSIRSVNAVCCPTRPGPTFPSPGVPPGHHRCHRRTARAHGPARPWSAHSPQDTRSGPSHPIARHHQMGSSATCGTQRRRSPTRPITRRPRRPDERPVRVDPPSVHHRRSTGIPKGSGRQRPGPFGFSRAEGFAGGRHPSDRPPDLRRRPPPPPAGPPPPPRSADRGCRRPPRPCRCSRSGRARCAWPRRGPVSCRCS